MNGVTLAHAPNDDGRPPLPELLGELGTRAGDAGQCLRAGHTERELAGHQLALSGRRVLLGVPHGLDEPAQIVDRGRHAPLIGIATGEEQSRPIGEVAGGDVRPLDLVRHVDATIDRRELHEGRTPPPRFSALLFQDCVPDDLHRSLGESNRPSHPRLMRPPQQIEGVGEVERVSIRQCVVAAPAEREPQQETAGDAEQRPGCAAPHGFDQQAAAEDSQRGRNPRAALQFHEWLMRLAAAAAPNPLSILTTVTPDAQEFSMASSAASPPNEAP